MSDRLDARCKLGSAAVFSVAEAVFLLPVRDSTARDWLEQLELIHNDPKLGRIVLWADVLDAIRRGDGPVDPPDAPARQRTSSLPRGGLRR